MAKKICRVLSDVESANSGNIDVTKMPVGDLFKTSTFTCEEYEFLGLNNRFYSPEYLNKLGAFARESQPKL